MVLDTKEEKEKKKKFQMVTRASSLKCDMYIFFISFIIILNESQQRSKEIIQFNQKGLPSVPAPCSTPRADFCCVQMMNYTIRTQLSLFDSRGNHVVLLLRPWLLLTWANRVGAPLHLQFLLKVLGRVSFQLVMNVIDVINNRQKWIRTRMQIQIFTNQYRLGKIDHIQRINTCI